MAGDDVKDDAGTGRPSRKRPLAMRLLRGWLISNVFLAVAIGCSLWAGHRWATANEENFEAAIEFGARYPVVLASLVDVYKLNPVHVEKLARLAEKILVDGAGMGRPRDKHFYWQARLLMAMPIFYAKLGLTADELARRERAIGLFAGLAERNPAKTDYRRRLAVTHSLQAEALQKLGRHVEAMEQWQRQRTIADALLRDEPGHWRWRWYVAISEKGIGDSLAATGLAEAASRIVNARNIAMDLCRERPDDARLCDLAAQAAKAAASGASKRAPG